MNNQSTFENSTWANGQPSIDIDPYEYSLQGFNSLIELLAKKYVLGTFEIITGFEEFMTTLTINAETVEVHMDNWTCSLAFVSEELRDEILAYLQN